MMARSWILACWNFKNFHASMQPSPCLSRILYLATPRSPGLPSSPPSSAKSKPEVFTMQFGQLWDFADGGAETSSGWRYSSSVWRFESHQLQTRPTESHKALARVVWRCGRLIGLLGGGGFRYAWED